jgi:iron complex transport system substrate-binding protein
MSRTDPPNPFHRRHRIAVMIVAALALAACGDDDNAESPNTSAGTDVTEESPAPTTGAPDTTEGAPAEAAAFPVTVEHKYGSTTVDSEPLRVVSVGYTDQDFLLALGVTPVGIRDWYGDQPFGTWPWAQDELGSAEPALLVDEELSFEQVAALEPDLIVGISSGMTEEQYDTLSKIAPTIAQPGEFVDYGTPWQEQTLMTGAALGKPAQAEELVADIESQFAQVRDEHPEFTDATAAVAFYFDDQPGAYASQDGRSRVMTDMGFTIPQAFDDLAGDSFFASFSAEQIDLLDTDVIVWIGGDELTIASLVESPLRAGMAAVQAGREVFLDVELGGAFSFGSPLSLPYLLDKLVPELALAVDGDPATVVPSAVEMGAVEGTAEGGGTDDGAAAGAAWALVFDSSVAFADKAPHLEDADALEPTLTEYTTSAETMGGFSVETSDVVVDGDTATVTYDILFGGTSAGYPLQNGTLTKVDGTWVVSRDQFCSYMASARLSCP